MSDLVHSIVIAAPAERVWTALTTGDDTREWWFENSVESSWHEGDPVVYRGPDGRPDIEGTVITARAPWILRTTFRPIWSPSANRESESVVEWSLRADGAVTSLTLTQSGVDNASTLRADLADGWTLLLTGLKTWRETGRPLLPSRGEGGYPASRDPASSGPA